MTSREAIEQQGHLVYSNRHAYEAIDQVIEKFSPMGYPLRLWTDEVAEFTRATVRDFGPASAAEARLFMRALGKFTMHCVHENYYPMERRVVLDIKVISAYCREKRKAGDPEANHESFLKRLSAELWHFDANDFRRGRKQNHRTFAPYDEHREVRIRTQGLGRSTALRRHNWTAIASLGGGFGLTGPETTTVKGQDVTDHGTHLSLRVHGDRARTSICRRSWESDIRRVLAESSGASWLVRTTTDAPMQPYRISKYLAEVSSWDDHFSVEQLRSTFIVRHLEANTSALHIIEMAGLESFGALDRLRPFVNSTSLHEHAQTLRLGRPDV